MKDRIREIRKDLKLNQTEFGTLIGATQGMVTSYESGRVVPSETMVELICTKFQIRKEWLLTGTGEKYDRPVAPQLVSILQKYPAVLELTQRLSDVLTADDWQRINDLIDVVLHKG